MANKTALKLADDMADHPILVGVDDGYAYTKVCVDGKAPFKMRTSIRQGVESVANMSGDGESDGCYETAGQRFTVGDNIQGENTRFDGYAGSAMNRVAIHHALRLAGLGGQKVKIATGLPVRSFYNGEGRINKEFIEQKRRGIEEEVSALFGGKIANIVDHVVCSEAVAAWLDHVLDDDGNPIEGNDDGGMVGIVDIGGRTTDCVWVLPPQKIDHKHSGTENIGVLNVFDNVQSAIQKRFETPVSRNKLEEAVLKGTLSLFGEKHDVNDIVEAAIANVAEQIHREIQRRFGQGADLDKILFVGGGAALMPRIAKHFKHGITPQNPEFANARGMLKFMKHKG
jgi:plasmid segregation protein ParM